MSAERLTDEQLIDLFWARNEVAIQETELKYGKNLRYRAYEILHSEQDAEECVNDTFLAAWNRIPPERPESLHAFLTQITKNLSHKRFRDAHRLKRGGMNNVFVELEDIADYDEPDSTEESSGERIGECISEFLRNQKQDKRVAFVKRYYYSESIEQIASELQMNEANVRQILSRTRKALQEYLRKEGIRL
ncbi:MAG: RNA polymerase sigma factor [Clostridia bacterium]|nr:RNA polymerase sigma factor [Clostridia bacterium]